MMPPSSAAPRDGDPAAAFEARVGSREITVAVIGLGYVGLPLAVACGERGFRVIGFDVDPDKITDLNAGRSYIRQVEAGRIGVLRSTNLFEATGDFTRLAEADAILICVPTPLGPHREPDLSFVTGTCETVAAALRPGQLVVLESTTYPGTTREVVRPILERGGLRSGEDFFLAYSPEREDPGNVEFVTSTIPRVVGGDGPAALAMAVALYGAVVVKVVPVSSLDTAEAVKITENVFRAVNIALVNELKLVYGAMGIDVWDVIAAAATKPFGFMPFYPGPGLGGHCIPIDPFYLTWKAREFDVPTRFIELAGEINTAMPHQVVDRVAAALDFHRGRGLKDARILVLGVAYKRNVADMRESPALRLIELMEERGATVQYHDPLIPVVPPTRKHGGLEGRQSVSLDGDIASRFDALVIATDHDEIDLAAVAATKPLIIDTRNACARAGITGPNVVKA